MILKKITAAGEELRGSHHHARWAQEHDRWCAGTARGVLDSGPHPTRSPP